MRRCMLCVCKGQEERRFKREGNKDISKKTNKQFKACVCDEYLVMKTERKERRRRQAKHPPTYLPQIYRRWSRSRRRLFFFLYGFLLLFPLLQLIKLYKTYICKGQNIHIATTKSQLATYPDRQHTCFFSTPTDTHTTDTCTALTLH